MKRIFSLPALEVSLTLLLLLTGAGHALTAEASLTAREVTVGETFQLIVKVTDDKNKTKLPWPEVGGNLQAFTITKKSGTSSSSQTSIINGRVSQRTNYITQFTYNLTPKRPGNYTIGPILYKHGKFSRNLGSARVSVIKTEPGLRLITTLSKRKVYIGEQVRYNLRIIPKASVQNIQAPDFQKHIGETFWMKQLDKEIKAKVVTLDGKQERVFDVRFALFPLIKGNAVLESVPLKYEEVVRRRRRTGSVFDMFESDFFGGAAVKKQDMTKPVSLNVLPLPSGAPAGFSGAVGQYRLRATVDKSSLPVGDALTLQIEISGNGRPKAITKPVLPELTNFEVFDPEIRTDTKEANGYLQSYKSFKYVLIPTRKGEFEIGQIEFPYFDSKTKSYKTAFSEALSVSVTKGKASGSTNRRLLTQREIEEIGTDIRHIKKTDVMVMAAQKYLYKDFRFLGLFILPPLIYGMLFFYAVRNRKLEEDTGLRRKVQAKGIARKRLSQARKAMQGEDAGAFYRALVVAVERFVSDKLNREFRGMTTERAQEILAEKNVPEPLRQEYLSLMETCDLGQFAGTVKNPETWGEAYQKAENLINRLNKAL